jgi:hypothetical protein
MCSLARPETVVQFHLKGATKHDRYDMTLFTVEGLEVFRMDSLPPSVADALGEWFSTFRRISCRPKTTDWS